MMKFSAICQIDTVNKINIDRVHVLMLIKDAENMDLYKAELDTLSGMYIDLYNKSALQDSLIIEQRRILKICDDGWADCEDIAEMQRREIEDLKYKARRRANIYKGIIIGLAAALIVK